MKKIFLSFVALILVILGTACVALPVKQPFPDLIVWEGRIILDRDTIIPENSTLIIKPGARIEFSGFRDDLVEHPAFPGAELVIKGKIIARGTKKRPIIFTSTEKTSARMSYWGAVNLSGGVSGEFSYCQFEFAESGLHCQNTELKLTNCRFFYNKIGLRFSDTSPFIKNCVFYNNDTAIQYHNASPQIVSSQITFNRVGIFCRFGSENTRIAYSNIYNNAEYNIKLGEEQAQDITARGNYWGEGEPFFALYDQRLSSYIGKVLIKPVAEKKYDLVDDLF